MHYMYYVFLTQGYLETLMKTKQQQAIFIEVVLKQVMMLTKLNISGCGLADAHVNLIANILPNLILLEELDVSRNFLKDNNVIILLTALKNCLKLSKLDISYNFLTLTGVVQIAYTFRTHRSIQILNMDNNITAFFSETEFIVDIILSTNQSLMHLSVCGRNIRPRFVKGYFYPPPNCESHNNRFILQSLYISRQMLLNHIAIKWNSVIELDKDDMCPLSSKTNITLFHVDCSGGTFYIQNHNFAIVVPPGAVLQGDCVQIRTNADRFASFELPDGYFPISSFFWISARYRFYIPVYLILSHFASVENTKNDTLCVAEVCDDVNHKEKMVMKIFPDGAYFDSDIGYCIVPTNHFCSFCLLSNRKSNDQQNFIALYYTYDITSPHEAHVAEVCFCPLNCDCIEVRRVIIVGLKVVNALTP